jgi:hypothetical protein
LESKVHAACRHLQRTRILVDASAAPTACGASRNWFTNAIPKAANSSSRQSRGEHQKIGEQGLGRPLDVSGAKNRCGSREYNKPLKGTDDSLNAMAFRRTRLGWPFPCLRIRNLDDMRQAVREFYSASAAKIVLTQHRMKATPNSKESSSFTIRSTMPAGPITILCTGAGARLWRRPASGIAIPTRRATLSRACCCQLAPTHCTWQSRWGIATPK